MVGRLGATAQAAVGYAAQLFFLAQSVLFALSFACVALMARAIGGRRPADARRALAASLVVAVAGALVLFAAIAAHPAPLLRRLAAEPAVIALCVPYLRLLMASTVLLAVCLTLESAFRADKRHQDADADHAGRDRGEARPQRAADLRRAVARRFGAGRRRRRLGHALRAVRGARAVRHGHAQQAGARSQHAPPERLPRAPAALPPAGADRAARAWASAS